MRRKLSSEFKNPVVGSVSLDEGARTPIEMPALGKTCTSASIMSGFVATTGLKGGDSGHGARAVFSLEDLASTDWTVLVTDSDGIVHQDSSPRKLTVVFGGDCEISNFRDLLISAANDLTLLLERTGTRLGADE